MSGSRQDIELAESIIADLDQPPVGGPPTHHLYQCRHTSPSSLIELLSSLDRESAAAPSPPKKGKRSSKRRVSGRTKYNGDDGTGALYVICNDPEWEEHYLPLLEMLDRPTEREFTVLPVESADPAEVINARGRACVDCVTKLTAACTLGSIDPAGTCPRPTCG